MTLDRIRLRATYEIITWPDDSEDYAEERGYVDVANPWGGFRTELPAGLCGEPFATWREENADTVTVDVWTAATMVRDFPGAVWDYSESGGAELQSDGGWLDVTLHVEDHIETVFAIADILPRR